MQGFTQNRCGKIEMKDENEPLFDMVNTEQLMSFEYYGFRQPMATLREKNVLQELWDTDEAPRKIWN
tara:strand:+ start:138 stop:338 length:201 start_codon:yes stop_codon:yes gene_type:complete